MNQRLFSSQNVRLESFRWNCFVHMQCSEFIANQTVANLEPKTGSLIINSSDQININTGAPAINDLQLSGR